MARITKGQILESLMTYGSEIRSYDFYEVVGVSKNGMATLRPLECRRIYYPGSDGNIYFNTPCDVVPTMMTRSGYNRSNGGLMPNIRRKIHNFGTEDEYVKPERWETATVWSGKRKAVWNLH